MNEVVLERGWPQVMSTLIKVDLERGQSRSRLTSLEADLAQGKGWEGYIRLKADPVRGLQYLTRGQIARGQPCSRPPSLKTNLDRHRQTVLEANPTHDDRRDNHI